MLRVKILLQPIRKVSSVKKWCPFSDPTCIRPWPCLWLKLTKKYNVGGQFLSPVGYGIRPKYPKIGNIIFQMHLKWMWFNVGGFNQSTANSNHLMFFVQPRISNVHPSNSHFVYLRCSFFPCFHLSTHHGTYSLNNALH